MFFLSYCNNYIKINYKKNGFKNTNFELFLKNELGFNFYKFFFEENPIILDILTAFEKREFLINVESNLKKLNNFYSKSIIDFILNFYIKFNIKSCKKQENIDNFNYVEHDIYNAILKV